MHTDIQITAEQLVKEALNLYKLKSDAPSVLVAHAISQLYPNSNGETVRATAIENSVIAGIEKMERQAAATESEFARIGQMSLFGELVPEHKVPKQLLTKSAAEMAEWMSQRAQIEQENADELRRASEAQERKAKRFSEWSSAVQNVYGLIDAAGLNPAEISYAEAVKKAETIQPRDRSVSSPTTKQPLR